MPSEIRESYKILFIVLLALGLNLEQAMTQIVYTDIDPDTTIYVPNVPYNVDASKSYIFDLNNDTIGDFRFIARNYSYSGSYGIILSLMKCNSNLVSGGCADGGIREDIYLYDTISNKLYWNTDKHIRFAVNSLFYCDLPVGDIYFGLMLLNGIDTLYGWVRCSATNNSITIKDYAYSTISDMPILAGQITSGTESLSPSDIISIHENNGFLTVDFSGKIDPNGHINIYNYLGVLVKTERINGLSNLVSLRGLTSGIYIVHVETEDRTVNKKIYIQSN